MTQRQEEFLALRREGMTFQQIGETCGVTKQRVQYALTTQIKKRKTSPLLERIIYPQIVDYLVDCDLSVAELVRKAGLASRTVYQGLTGARQLRKGEIDAILKVIGGTYETVFKEEAG